MGAVWHQSQTILQSGIRPALVGAITRSSASYLTEFPLTENPISEGGRWVSAAQMSPRTAMRTTPGKAFGTAPAYNNDNIFTDSAAHLTGFSADHEVIGTVFNNGAANLEIELFLRADFSAAHTFGYEIDLYVNSGIISLVRWDGTAALPNVFTFLRDGNGHEGEAPGLTGDIVRARIVGTQIWVYYTPFSTGIEALLSGFPYDTSGDTIKLSAGQPGMGTFTNAGGTASSNLSWSKYLARDI